MTSWLGHGGGELASRRDFFCKLLEVTPLAPPQKPQPTVGEWLQLHERGVVDAAELRRQLSLEAHGAVEGPGKGRA
ncbi:protein of unknown function [Cyanobium sp. NIES-981]|nr:protein of unknown function [Cyanobium sp. NIES-981]